MRASFGLLCAGGLVASVLAVVQGLRAGYLWGGLALLGLVGVIWAGRFGSDRAALRLYSGAFCAALFAVALVFAVLAAAAEPDERGGFVGMAVLWSTMGGAATAVMVAVERRLRRSPSPAPDGHPPEPS